MKNEWVLKLEEEIQDISNSIRKKAGISMYNKQLSINLKVLNAYRFGTFGSVKLSGYTFDKENKSKILSKTGVIVGYRLKNIDTKPLWYMKTVYQPYGVEYEKVSVEPNEEFIVTRHDLVSISIVNGHRLDNGVIASVVPSQIALGRELDYAELKLPYIRLFSNRVHDEGFVIDIHKESMDIQGNKVYAVQNEYKKHFYWVELDKYFVTRRRYIELNVRQPQYRYSLQKGEILIDKRDNNSVTLIKMNEHYKNIEFIGNATQHEINELISRSKDYHKTEDILETIIDNTYYVYSPKKIVVYPRDLFKHKVFGTINLARVKVYSHSLSNIFYDTIADNLVLGEVEEPETISGFRKNTGITRCLHNSKIERVYTLNEDVIASAPPNTAIVRRIPSLIDDVNRNIFDEEGKLRSDLIQSDEEMRADILKQRTSLEQDTRAIFDKDGKLRSDLID